MNFSKELANISLDTCAIKFDPKNPFLWASGYRMPIYNDNRLLLGNSKHRQLIAEGFHSILNNKNIEFDVIAGTATAGIPHATSLANLLGTPLIYVRQATKGHGMKNKITEINKYRNYGIGAAYGAVTMHILNFGTIVTMISGICYGEESTVQCYGMWQISC